MNKIKSRRGFTLIELLVVISIIGFLTVATIVILNIVRMNARDAVRVGNIATIKRSLAMYLNDSLTGYPASGGECLSTINGSVGWILKNSQVLLNVPFDPLWPEAVPGTITNGFAAGTSKNFCYYYFSDNNARFQISYYLESNSKSGNAGINTTTQ